MKRTFILALIVFALTGCNKQNQAENQAIDPVKQFQKGITGFFELDTTQTYFEAFWKNRELKTFQSHFSLSSGKIAVENDALVGGILNFHANFTSPIKDKKIESLLNSSKWMAIENHPSLNFKITTINPYMTGSPEADADTAKNKIANPNINISGMLLMKDTSIQVSFPANFTLENGVPSLLANFHINRAFWKVGADKDTIQKSEYLMPQVQFQLRVASKKK